MPVNPALMDASKNIEFCEDCNNKGYLVIMAENLLKSIHGNRPNDESLPEIQKCDACDLVPDDHAAQLAFMHDVIDGVVEIPDQLVLWGPNRSWEA